MANIDTNTMIDHVDRFLKKNGSMTIDITDCVNTSHVIAILRNKGYQISGTPKNLHIKK